MTPAFLGSTAAAILLFLIGIICVRNAEDSYGVFKLVVLLCAFASLLASALYQPYSFFGLLPWLTVPLALGVVVGSWPDALKRWMRLLWKDVIAFRHGFEQDWREWKEWPIMAGALLGVGLGLWAWSGLANSLGAIGALMGTFAFVAIVFATLFLLLATTDRIRPQSQDPPEHRPL